MTTFSLIVFFLLFIVFQCLELSIQSLVVSQLTTHVPASTAKKSVSVMCVCARANFNVFNENLTFQNVLQTDFKHQGKPGTEGI